MKAYGKVRRRLRAILKRDWNTFGSRHVLKSCLHHATSHIGFELLRLIRLMNFSSMCPSLFNLIRDYDKITSYLLLVNAVTNTNESRKLRRRRSVRSPICLGKTHLIQEATWCS